MFILSRRHKIYKYKILTCEKFIFWYIINIRSKFYYSSQIYTPKNTFSSDLSRRGEGGSGGPGSEGESSHGFPVWNVNRTS